MSFEQLITHFRKQYTTFSHLDDVDFLLVIESKLVDLDTVIPIEELTNIERENLKLLPTIQEFLQ